MEFMSNMKYITLELLGESNERKNKAGDTRFVKCINKFHTD